MDSLAAAAVGVSPEEIRARNFIGADAFPYESSRRPRLRQRRLPGRARQGGVVGRARRSAGPSRPSALADGSSKRIGIGFSSYVEMCGLAPSRVLASLDYGAGGWEAATVAHLAHLQGAGRDRLHAPTAKAMRRAGR